MEEDNKSEIVEMRVGDTIYKTQLNDMYKNRKPYRPPNSRELFSFIPGTISEVNVRKGSKVKEGEVLALLEAMKMKNQVLAPFDGKVKAVYVKSGQIVPKNFLMIELER